MFFVFRSFSRSFDYKNIENSTEIDRKTYRLIINNYVYSSQSIFQIISDDEDRKLWSLYLNKAIASGEDHLFDLAFENTKTDVY